LISLGRSNSVIEFLLFWADLYLFGLFCSALCHGLLPPNFLLLKIITVKQYGKERKRVKNDRENATQQKCGIPAQKIRDSPYSFFPIITGELSIYL
jgi:hypothetical protein